MTKKQGNCLASLQKQISKTSFSLMLDSGAHAIFENFVRCGTGIWDRHLWNWSYYGSEPFWQYVDDYADFVKNFPGCFDIYVSLDAIYDPKTSYETFIYLREKHGLNPLPVYHYAEPIEWLKKYMDATDYIGISGLGQGINKKDYIQWADRVFSLVCSGKDHLPKYKIHGFALTSTELIHRWPWYSVDSSSWVQFSQYGKVIIPKMLGNKRSYKVKPYEVFVSTRSPAIGKDEEHFETLSKMEQAYILDYLHSLNINYGKSHFKTVDVDYKCADNEKPWGKAENGKKKIEVIEEYGVSNRHEYRDMVNYQFYVDLENSVPAWPWPWKRTTSRFGLIKT